MKYYDSIKCATPIEAIMSNTPALAYIRLKEGEVLVKAILVKLLNNLVKFFNVGKSMTDAQVAETVELILTSYYYFKIADFKVCFDGIKSGKYLDGGKLFDRLDGQIILGALATYSEERLTLAEDLKLAEHKKEQERIAFERSETKYLVQVGEDYIRESDTSYFFEPKKELATTYTYNAAYALKMLLLQNDYEDVKMVNEKQISNFMDRLIVDKPDLVDKKTKFHYATKDYYAKKQAIEASDMSLFDKCNAIRALSELEPFSKEEYAAYVAAINGGK